VGVVVGATVGVGEGEVVGVGEGEGEGVGVDGAAHAISNDEATSTNIRAIQLYLTNDLFLTRNLLFYIVKALWGN
jgi:hypothetical protein